MLSNLRQCETQTHTDTHTHTQKKKTKTKKIRKNNRNYVFNTVKWTLNPTPRQPDWYAVSYDHDNFLIGKDPLIKAYVS